MNILHAMSKFCEQISKNPKHIIAIMIAFHPSLMFSYPSASEFQIDKRQTSVTVTMLLPDLKENYKLL